MWYESPKIQINPNTYMPTQPKCFMCGQKVSGAFLTVDYTPPMRGNENDFRQVFCKACSNGNPLWHEAKYKDQIARLESDKQKLVEAVEKAQNFLKTLK